MPEGVPLTGGGVVLPWLHEGCSKIRVKNRTSANPLSQTLRRRLRPAPSPSKVIPGTINQKAYNGPRHLPEPIVLGGWGVVVRFRTDDCGPFEVRKLRVAVVGVQVAEGGGELQLSETLDENTGCGETTTVYAAT